MRIENGIAYAENAKPLLKASAVKALADHKLWVKFNNGAEKLFDFSDLLDKPAFAPLSDEKVFGGVYIEYGVPVWLDGEIDIAPETIFERGEDVTCAE